jgi:hypothetical protein
MSSLFTGDQHVAFRTAGSPFCQTHRLRSA